MTKFEETVQRGAEEVARLVGDKGPKYATYDEAFNFAAGLQTDALTCRLKRHRFTVPIDAVHNKKYHFIYVVLGCVGNCGVRQVYEMNEHGHIYWGPYLRYPKSGYLSPVGRIAGDGTDALRIQWHNRVVKPHVIVSRASSKQHKPKGS